MNSKAAWNMLKRKLLSVWLPTAGVILLIILGVQ